jgi:hypothetical protein
MTVENGAILKFPALSSNIKLSPTEKFFLGYVFKTNASGNTTSLFFGLN